MFGRRWIGLFPVAAIWNDRLGSALVSDFLTGHRLRFVLSQSPSIQTRIRYPKPTFTHEVRIGEIREERVAGEIRIADDDEPKQRRCAAEAALGGDRERQRAARRGCRLLEPRAIGDQIGLRAA